VEIIEIDLTKSTIDEAAGRTLGNLGLKVKRILSAMFGGISLPTTVKGSKQDIQSFLDTLVKEKKYMGAYLQYGLNDPRTYHSKALLNNATRNFERVTGIKWPFK